MKELYPLKFHSIYKNKIWGGKKLAEKLGKKTDIEQKIGESWEISGVQDNISVVENGFLAGNEIQELIEIYMGDLIGEKIFKKFGVEFPLLFKFIDANDKLSIQVHPNNEIAKKRHKAYGKTEMWYVLETEKDAEIIIGFNQELDKKDYINAFENNKLKQILNHVKVKKGDVFFLPSGRVHSIGKGVLLAEIQQTSDITYRIYDWERKDKNGNPRELHVDLAKDTIDFKFHENYLQKYEQKLNETVKLVDCDFFSCNVIEFNKSNERVYIEIDSFVVLMCVEGKFEIDTNQNEKVKIKKGETVLIPAEIDIVNLLPIENTKVLEIYIKLK